MNDIAATPSPMSPSVPTVALPAAEQANPVIFTGTRSEFARLLGRGSVLEFFTLGFYRFWLATDMRRHLWTHTAVGGDAPEYTGTAKELLIGFLFALAILLPVNLAYFFISFEAELLQVFASVPLILFFYLFYQFAMYRARRYRLTRTVWRGVRFWMTGSGWSYAWRASLWMLLVVVSAGLALPWGVAALERYKMRHSHYGDLAGRFDGTGGALFARTWWLWLVTILMFGAIGVAGMTRPELAGLLALVVVLASPFFYAVYRACEWRWWVSGIGFGDLRFDCKLAAGAFVGLYWKVIGWSALLLFLLVGWIMGVVFAAIAASGAKGMSGEAVATALQHPAVLVVGALGYIACALAFGFVLRMYLRRDVWARVAAASMVINLSAADHVTARGEVAGSLGEGLADSLGGGF